MPLSKDLITTNTLATSVTEQLWQMIADGQIANGEYLPSQKELATRFGVGLSTIREAIQKLSAMGLVKSHPGKGTWVSTASFSNLMDAISVKSRLGELKARPLYEARLVIEVALTQYAAQRANRAQIGRIWAALNAMETATTDRDFVEADLDFHLAVAAAGNNELLEQFYHLTRKLLSEIVAEMVVLPEVKERSIFHQRKIVLAIEAGEVEEARLVALDHMHYIKDLLDAYE